jgi:hypothetical protein
MQKILRFTSNIINLSLLYIVIQYICIMYILGIVNIEKKHCFNFEKLHLGKT